MQIGLSDESRNRAYQIRLFLFLLRSTTLSLSPSLSLLAIVMIEKLVAPQIRNFVDRYYDPILSATRCVFFENNYCKIRKTMSKNKNSDKPFRLSFFLSFSVFSCFPFLFFTFMDTFCTIRLDCHVS